MVYTIKKILSVQYLEQDHVLTLTFDDLTWKLMGITFFLQKS